MTKIAKKTIKANNVRRAKGTNRRTRTNITKKTKRANNISRAKRTNKRK